MKPIVCRQFVSENVLVEATPIASGLAHVYRGAMLPVAEAVPERPSNKQSPYRHSPGKRTPQLGERLYLVTVEARDANGNTTTKVLPIRVAANNSGGGFCPSIGTVMTEETPCL